MLPSLSFIVVSISRKKFFIFALLREAKFSRAPIKHATRWWGSELQRKVGSGSSTRSEEIKTDIATCFLIQVILFVSLKFFSWTEIDSKSNIDKVSKNFVYSCTWYRKSPACRREFLEFNIRSLDRHFSLRHCIELNVAPSWMFCWKKCHN